MNKKSKVIIIYSIIIASFALALFLPPIINTNSLGTYTALSQECKLLSFTLYINNKSISRFEYSDAYKGDWYIMFSANDNLFDIYIKYSKNSYLQLRQNQEGIYYNVHNNNECYTKV